MKSQMLSKPRFAVDGREVVTLPVGGSECAKVPWDTQAGLEGETGEGMPLGLHLKELILS